MLSTDFFYNGKKSIDLGVYLVKLNNDYTVTPFLADKEIVEEEIAGNDKPYYFGVKRKPLKLKLILSCLEDQWTIDKRRDLARWLNVNSYELFYSLDNPNKWYYCQYVGGIDLNYLGTLQGYIEVEMRCDGSYPYSPIYGKVLTFSETTEPQIFEFTNDGDLDLQPQLWIEKVGDGDIEIQNLTYGDLPMFKFTGLLNQETVYIDNENEIIETDLTGHYRYVNFNDGYLSLKRGVNRLKVTGNGVLQFRWQYKILG
jgi:phage-related protein